MNVLPHSIETKSAHYAGGLLPVDTCMTRHDAKALRGIPEICDCGLWAHPVIPKVPWGNDGFCRVS